MSRSNIVIGFVLAALLAIPVTYVLVVVLSSPGLEYKEFVYVGSEEIERVDLYVLLPLLGAASTPFVIGSIAVVLFKMVKRWLATQPR
jgi:hypothetical protein